MFDKTVKKILEGFNVFPRARVPLTPGPNVNSTGPLPAGFLGGGLPGINPSSSLLLLKKPKKKKTKIKKKPKKKPTK
jgi:hypothetical protein